MLISVAKTLTGGIDHYIVNRMSVELEEVRAFLSQTEPFTHLPGPVLERLPAQIDLTYVRRGETIIRLGDPNDYCFIIRSGAVDIIGEEELLLDRREAGRCFGFSTIMGENKSRYTMTAVEDCLLMKLGRDDFLSLIQDHPDVARFFSSQSKRISAAASQMRQDPTSEILRTKLQQFMVTTPVTVNPEVSIQDAARTMQERNVSSLLITDQAAEHRGQVLGIITDRDLRKKVVAENLDVSLPVTEIMTAHPRTLPSDAQAFEAMIVMSELGIHHLPVADEGKLVGIVASPDIMRLLRNDPIYLTADLAKKSTPEELKEVYTSADEVAMRFIDRGSSPEAVSGLLTVAADSLTRRLIQLAEEQFGPAPVPYSFVVVGSQGRRGMGFASDQDNCLVLDNSYNEAEHGEYFAQLSEFVCTGLDNAGQVLCPGEMMAMNPKWRMTQDTWIHTFRQWITAPEPDALLHAQTFFDFRSLYSSAGGEELAESVHLAAVEMARDAGRMHAHLATLAARREPPLGFFRGFVLDRSGEYANTLDVKKGGTAAVVQMARLYSLASGVTAVGTRQRLQQAAGQGAVSQKGAQDLIDAFDFLNTIAFRYQSAQLKRGEEASYHIDPQRLSKMDREHLRDAFQIIKGMQNALATKFPVRNI